MFDDGLRLELWVVFIDQSDLFDGDILVLDGKLIGVV